MTLPNIEGHMKSVGVIEGDIYVDVLGVPYGGPPELGDRDVEGEFFSKSTDLGPLNTFLSYIGHASYEEMGLPDDFAKSLVGVAKKLEETEEGIIYRILVDKNYKYRNLVKRLADEGVWLASSHPFQRSVEINNRTGHIDRWHIVELGLSVSAANPKAKQIIAKSLQELQETDTMAQKKIKDDSAEVPDVLNGGAGTTEVVSTTTTSDTTVTGDTTVVADNTEQKSLTEQVNEILNVQTETTTEEDKAKTEEKTVDAAKFEAMEKSLGRIEEMLGKMNVVDQVTGLEKSVTEIKEIIPTLAKAIAVRLAQEQSDNKQKSTTERQAEQRTTTSLMNQFKNGLPSNAPGLN